MRVTDLRGDVQEVVFVFQAEDGIRDLVRSRGLGDVYKRQPPEADDERCDEQRDDQQPVSDQAEV